MKNEIILDGPWIDEIKSIFNSKNVKESIINQRNKEKEERLQYELKEKRQKECCENKKKNILNNYR